MSAESEEYTDLTTSVLSFYWKKIYRKYIVYPFEYWMQTHAPKIKTNLCYKLEIDIPSYSKLKVWVTIIY